MRLLADRNYTTEVIHPAFKPFVDRTVLFCFDVRDILPLDLVLLPHDLAFPRPKHRTFLHQPSTSPCEQVANVSCLGVNEALHG